ncbi:DUF2177 family protein [Paenirhodobacter hankyongi]|uniref:DUF2177 family protein n=1 Tax=Paenirhodobacter hankyongi TaxID=2294033 RepID=A0A421BJD3_9RHOB|nr:DUF2177 family protein [Sinirhodobacter hankyongi]RLL62099.1 DUF2177 family protein [Sinirhodobacter hankyongi]
MANYALLYLTTAAAFLVTDIIGIRLLIRPVFERHVGHLLADPMRIGAAAAFYLAYVAGVLWFVSIPALKAGAPVQALLGGMVLGLLCYGTYEMTNYATLRDWSVQQVVIDGLWGMGLTGFAAWAGVAVLGGKLG